MSPAAAPGRAGAELVRTRDAVVRARAVGVGPPVLLVNGLGAHMAMWSHVESSLAGRRLIEFDLPGAGDSPAPLLPRPIWRVARVAADVLSHFDVDQCDVVGYSMGGVVAQQLAHDHPGRVRRLVLVATTPGRGAVPIEPVALANILTPIRYASPRLYTRSIASLVGGRARHDPDWVASQSVLRMDHRPSWRGYLGQLQSIARWSSLPLLRAVRHQTLVVVGGDDPLSPLANSAMIAHLLPHARLHVAEGEGHLLLLDDRSAVHAAIAEFLAAPTGADSGTWRAARVVDADLVRAQLAAARWQPRWGRGARTRARWLRPGALPAT